MTVIETSFKIESDSKISSLISWRNFRSDKDFLETLEDFLFWKIIEEWDKKDYVSEDDVLKVLSNNLW